MNVDALITVVVLAAALLAIFGSLYMVAVRAYRRGELAFEGVSLLRWALLGHVGILLILAITAFIV